MANNFYRKEDYIKRCRTQRDAYLLLINAMKALMLALPNEEGKRFTMKNIEALNKNFEGEKIHFWFMEQWETRYLCISIQDARYNNVCHNIELGWNGLFKGGKISDLKGLKEQITNTINLHEKQVERYEKAVEESQIRLFQARYAAFHKAYEELKAMDIPEIYLEYLSENCPIRG